MNDKNPSMIESVAASGLVSASLLASLVGMLAGKAILSDAEIREIYDQALHLIEVQQAQSDALQMGDIYESARNIIEDQLQNL